jgi:hypothetical protein
LRAIQTAWEVAEDCRRDSRRVLLVKTHQGWCRVFPEYLISFAHGSDYVPSLAAHVSADDQGNINRVETSRLRWKRLAAQVAQYDQLHTQAAGVAGYFDGPSLSFCVGPPSAALWCDEELSFRHVADALDAISTHVEADGTRKALIETVVLSDGRIRSNMPVNDSHE